MKNKKYAFRLTQNISKHIYVNVWNDIFDIEITNFFILQLVVLPQSVS